MLNPKLVIGSLIGAALIGGSAFIVYNGRPVMKLKDDGAAEIQPGAAEDQYGYYKGEEDNRDAGERDDDGAVAPVPAPTAPAKPSGTYSMAEVSAHATSASCWSAISGNVYDLTTWIERHPGGSGAILGLCGTDGTAKYSGKHGGAERPASMLVLLKIGTLR